MGGCAEYAEYRLPEMAVLNGRISQTNISMDLKDQTGLLYMLLMLRSTAEFPSDSFPLPNEVMH